ncbi:MAG TPA: PfkB family carbohydrate kinase [Gaiellaceae bacterium]|nr:PfkB family carbohydrate kinase [Gaiellaceae bacterium]
MSVRFLAVGDLMVDVVARGEGHSARIAVAPGGSAFNSAVAATGLGAGAAVVGRVGDDAAGRMLLAELAAHGVRTRVGVDPAEPTGTVLVVDGEIRADRGANAAFAPEHLPALEADAVLVSGNLPPETALTALADARAAWVALDAARLDALPAAIPIVLANEDAARRLTGGLDPEEAALRLAAGRRLACVTLGRRGAVAASEGRVERGAALDAPPGDPPGAGDAFAAALVVELARGAVLSEALAAACNAGAAAAGRATARAGR